MNDAYKGLLWSPVEREGHEIMEGYTQDSNSICNGFFMLKKSE